MFFFLIFIGISHNTEHPGLSCQYICKSRNRYSRRWMFLSMHFSNHLYMSQFADTYYFSQSSFLAISRALKISISSVVVILIFFSEPGQKYTFSPSSTINVHEAVEFVIPRFFASSCAHNSLESGNVCGVCVLASASLEINALALVPFSSSRNNIASAHGITVIAESWSVHSAMLLEIIS